MTASSWWFRKLGICVLVFLLSFGVTQLVWGGRKVDLIGACAVAIGYLIGECIRKMRQAEPVTRK